MHDTRLKHRGYQPTAIDLSKRLLSQNCTLFPRQSIGTTSSSMHRPRSSFPPPSSPVQGPRGPIPSQGGPSVVEVLQLGRRQQHQHRQRPRPAGNVQVRTTEKTSGRERAGGTKVFVSRQENQFPIAGGRRSAFLEAESFPRSVFHIPSANQQTAVKAGRASRRETRAAHRPPRHLCDHLPACSAFLLPKSRQVQCRFERAEPGRELGRQLV